MLRTLSIKAVLAATLFGACAFPGAASAADGEAYREPGVYWRGQGWSVSQKFDEEAGWCSARVDYRGGERLELIGDPASWRLRISHPKWGGIEKGALYGIVLSTDRRWAVRYAAWGFEDDDGARRGLRMPTFPGALKALSRAGAAYFVDEYGDVVAALDMTGSAKAIEQLKSCREDMARAGDVEGRARSRLIVSKAEEGGAERAADGGVDLAQIDAPQADAEAEAGVDSNVEADADSNLEDADQADQAVQADEAETQDAARAAELDGPSTSPDAIEDADRVEDSADASRPRDGAVDSARADAGPEQAEGRALSRDDQVAKAVGAAAARDASRDAPIVVE